jgi:membrane protein
MQKIISIRRHIFENLHGLYQKLEKDQLFFLSGWLSYRVLLAFFPFIIFLISLMGYLHLDTAIVLESIYGMFPYDVYRMLEIFVNETAYTRSPAILSTSIMFVLISSINGFRAVTRSINNAYDTEDRRSLPMQAALSIILMLIFTMAIIVMLVFLIFGGLLWNLLHYIYVFETGVLNTVISGAISFVLLTIVIMLIYKLSCAKKLTMRNVLPGAVFTVLSWIITSYLFGYFISNFSNVSAIYGSIAGIFILMIWLNLIAILLLIGNEINAFRYKPPEHQSEIIT